MSVDRRHSQETALIVHHITSFILREEKKVFGDVLNSFSATDGSYSSADGTCVDFQDRRPDFQEAVATLEKGYKLLMQNHGLEMRKYSEDFAGVIDEAQFLEFAATLTIADIGGLNWGRILALFTMSGLLTLQLVRRKQQDVVKSLQEWLTTFIDDHLSSWIERQGGWTGIQGSIAFPPTEDQQTLSLSGVWQWLLSKLRMGSTDDRDKREKLEKELAELKARQRQLERAVAEKQKDVVKEEHEKATLQQTNIGLKQQVRDLESQLKDTSAQISTIMDGIRSLQVGQSDLREGQEELRIGQEIHHTLHRLEHLQQNKMAEGIQELQAGQREIQDRQEEAVLAQQSSEIQQRLGQIEKQEATTSQLADIKEAVDGCADLVVKSAKETGLQMHKESEDVQRAVEHGVKQLKKEIRSIAPRPPPTSPITPSPMDDDVKNLFA